MGTCVIIGLPEIKRRIRNRVNDRSDGKFNGGCDEADHDCRF